MYATFKLHKSGCEGNICKRFNRELESISSLLRYRSIAFITNFHKFLSSSRCKNRIFRFHSKVILIFTLQINDTKQPSLDFPVDGTFYKSGQQSEGVPFSGQLTYEGSLSHLQGDFRTQSVWKKAFGIEYLAMNNLRIG